VDFGYALQACNHHIHCTVDNSHLTAPGLSGCVALGRSFFRDAYLAYLLTSPFLVSWWWIAFRIVSIVTILRNRHDPQMLVQFIILSAGLSLAAILLSLFFLSPLLHRFFPTLFRFYDHGLWLSHSLPIVIVLLWWAGVIFAGLSETAPNISFPCSGSMSPICMVMTAYA
jgi:hypothetical protein